ncbi:glycogen synthase GlgA [Hydrogenophaga laconesensis]|uniref:Glycogen synthase n=1 Tax=Hydrogenophaga laconesensis TaxID=1805971 RepID=A0ABU1V796_9BURK|nr:glycogen synthase GlgA [Hydrogenophaga laconesensis]MDR7093300.1 starch synthase [Hydrogenophaga laconesensis]
MKPKVLYVCSEVFPLLKTGGLADVSAGLPPALTALGADVRLLLPAFPRVVEGVTPEGPTLLVPPGGSPGLPAGVGPQATSAHGPTPWLRAGRITESGTPVWLLHAPGLYERGGNPYLDPSGQPWPDSAEQFAWLGWAAALLGTGLHAAWLPDIVHGHDWHTGLAFAYLRELARTAEHRPATVFTVHNLAYQGVFNAGLRPRLGLPDGLFHLQGLEFHGQISFMKAGLKYSDAITTVSPTYAREITGAEQGCGLDGVLRQRQAHLHGILNGVDDAVWNPQTDPLVQPGFDAGHLDGKARAKARLQQRMGLEPRADALLFSVVSRLTEQKGLHLLPAVVDELVQRGGQLAVLGSGDAAIERALRACAQRHPAQVALTVGYDEALAHTVIAGADVILLPSRFEPCGLTQLYGLRYGTLPLVRAVGGLADTVVDCSLENLDDGSASGFVFRDLDVPGLLSALRRAFALRRRPVEWRAVQRHGMSLRFGWERAAADYLRVYTAVLPSPGGP